MLRGIPSTPTAMQKFVWPLLIVLAGLLIRLPLLDAPGFRQDQEQFIVWGFVASEGGLASVYELQQTAAGPRRLSNYPPVQIYLCRMLTNLYAVVVGRPLDLEIITDIMRRAMTPEAVAAYVLFKWPAVIADIAIALALYFCLRSRLGANLAGAAGLVYAVLPSVWHNSAVWGAVDALPVLLLILSMQSALARRFEWMWGCAMIAMLTKPQACIFLPLWIIVCLRPGPMSARTSATTASILLAILAVAILPFHGAIGGIVEAYTGAPGFYPLTHLNGFSAWFLGRPMIESHLDGNLLEHYARDDLPFVLGLSARQLGIAAFAGVLAFVCTTVWRRRANDASLFWAVRVIPLAFFVLSTQMHERYIYPAVALWAWSISPTLRDWIAWIALGFCAAVNVFWVWPAPFEDAIGPLLHRAWLGIPPGVWCATAVLGITLWTALGLKRDEPWAEGTTGEETPTKGLIK